MTNDNVRDGHGALPRLERCEGGTILRFPRKRSLARRPHALHRFARAALDLSRLCHLCPEATANLDAAENRAALIASGREVLAAERHRASIGHYAYDAARHRNIALTVKALEDAHAQIN